MKMDRTLIRGAAAVLLLGAGAFPWVEAWPVANPGEAVLAEPVARFADIYPHFGPRGWWNHDEYESVQLRRDVILRELVAIGSTAAWALARLDRREALEKKPLYCELGEVQVSAGAISSSGTVGPLG
jgi:hypothetical protein